ncbi:MAG: CPXCG motif-containing cysteine-rich protein [Gammaproteobacteria bacterium]|jgi:predicted DsbA family dithiol-disulfide isomerase
MQEEAEITCPFCWEVQTILLDLSVPEQEYIEDCQVCCQPILIRYTSEAGELINLLTERS